MILISANKLSEAALTTLPFIAVVIGKFALAYSKSALMNALHSAGVLRTKSTLGSVTGPLMIGTPPNAIFKLRYAQALKNLASASNTFFSSALITAYLFSTPPITVFAYFIKV